MDKPIPPTARSTTAKLELDEDPHDGPHLVLWLVAACTAFLLLAGGAGYWWRAHHQDSPAAGAALQEEDRAQVGRDKAADITCAEGMTAFQDQSFGLGFCYPLAWGKAIVHDDKFEPADQGSRWMVSFPNQPAVRAALVSNDWHTNVGRDGGCADPQGEVVYDHFSAAWQAEGLGSDMTYASRDVSSKANVYRIEEYVDNLLTNGVCLRAYATVSTALYRTLTVSYYAAFDTTVHSPEQHVNHPDHLISVADRRDIAAVAASAKRFGN